MTVDRRLVNEVWKDLALFLSGAVITLLGIWGSHVKNEVTQETVVVLIDSKIAPQSVKLDMLLTQQATLEKKFDSYVQRNQK